jgi:2,3-bisphosphoglycerate-independent phosphoglycerate mutase
MIQKTILIILDGWGHGKDPKRSALAQANTPFINNLYSILPNAELLTHGLDVGLPEGQMGNSEVGHMNIGAGRIVYQTLTRIDNAIENGEFQQNAALINSFKYCKENNKTLHLLGLVSNGGVHAHIKHLKTIILEAEKFGLKKIFIHAITDGRDVDPKSGKDFIEDLMQFIKDKKTKIATICGRYFTMDRDNRWERIKIAYDAYVNGIGEVFENPAQAIQKAYDKDETDEFIKPIIIKNDGEINTIQKDDAIIAFNFRTDRCREITHVLTQLNNEQYNMKKIPLHYTTMTLYDESFKNIHVIFENDNLYNTIGEILSKNNCTQLRIAETEKYPHVTFFFSGGREQIFEGEDRILIPSPKVATYDLQPKMSANELTYAVIDAIENKKPDFICLNFANADMVGHTGIFKAAVEAAETIDNCLKKIFEVLEKYNYSAVIIADHGNSDVMINEDGTPNTAHSTNLVPIFVNDKNTSDVQNGRLADVAPTILKIMGLNIPKEMTGKILVN